MVKRSALVVLLLVLAFSAILLPQGLAADDDESPTRPGNHWSWPWKRSWPGRSPVPPPDPQVMKKCVDSFKSAVVCVRPHVGKDCCAALKGIQEDCTDLKFGRFNPALFDTVLKKRCGEGAI